MRSSDSAPLLLNNYRGAGIGDFGLEFAEALRARYSNLRVEETSPSGPGFSAQLERVARAPGPLVANVGLTAWGRSGVRNYLGFRSIRRHRAGGAPTVAIVHHTIEGLARGDTGYRLSWLVRWGAHRALAMLSRCALVSFSPELAATLRVDYDVAPKLVTPLPCRPPIGRPEWDRSGPTVVGLGYWSPYKGIDEFLAVAEAMRGTARFVLAGAPHRVLSEDPAFGERVARWRERAAQLGVETPGFVPTEKLALLLGGRAVALMPYGSSSGSSATFATLASWGVPVIASDLAEFRFVKERGAGVTITETGPTAYRSALERLLSDRVGWEREIARQHAFAAAHAWPRFVDALAPMIEGDPAG